MSYFNIVAATSENTVVTEYIPEQRTAEAYQSEAELNPDELLGMTAQRIFPKANFPVW